MACQETLQGQRLNGHYSVYFVLGSLQASGGPDKASSAAGPEGSDKIKVKQCTPRPPASRSCGSTEGRQRADIASCVAEFEGEDKIEVSLSNAYAGYGCHIYIHVKNVGSVHAVPDLQQVIISPPTPMLSVDEILFGDLNDADSVLSPGEEGFLRFTIRVTEDGEPSTTYVTTITLVFKPP